MQHGLIIVSNRLPVSVKKVDGELEFFPSIGGLATGLAPYAKDKRNKWIGWPGLPSDDLTEKERRLIAEELQAQNCYPVFLTQKQLDDYYNGYSNSVLWPVFHDNHIGKAAENDEEKLWKAYQKVNALFAEAVLALSSAGSNIWVHDYQLFVLPALLRRERPDDKIGFFLHTPFPSIEFFSRISQAPALLAGVLGADLAGFHTESYVQNFLDAVQQYDIGVTAHKKVILADRVVRVTDFPIGIDYEKYEKARKSRAVTREYAKLKLEYQGLKVILTVDRLDPAKGLVERAKAYQTLLRENPHLRGQVVMVMLVVPSRTEIAEYKAVKEELEQVIQDTNEEFGMPPWIPIDYLYTALPFEQVTALYRRADVAFIAPFRDGMNLVAKEYLASKPGKSGALVLSRTAGAAQELKDAVMVDPNRPRTLVTGLSKALNMSPKELKKRANRMQKLLSTSTIQTWAGGFMKTLRQESRPRNVITATLTPAREKSLIADYRTAESRLLLLDYDGVLMDFKMKFQDATPNETLSKLLKRLVRDPANTVVVISGRTKKDLQHWFEGQRITLVAEHGAFWRDEHGKWHTVPVHVEKGWHDRVLPILYKYAANTPGAVVEEKEMSLVWHYRNAKPYYAQKYLVVLKRVLQPLAKKLGLQVQQGNMILEVRPDGIDKGTTAQRWLRHKPQFILAMGDDYTDEDTFRALPPHAYSIKVGRGRTAARFRIKNVSATIKLLEKLSKQ